MAGARSYSSGTRAALNALADGTCYFPGCTSPTIVFVDGDPFTNADIAHIRDAKPGNRYDSDMSDKERAHFDNLILLCRPHHQLVDKARPEEYPSARLADWKKAREDASTPGGKKARRRHELVASFLSSGGYVAAPELALPLDPPLITIATAGQLTPYQILWPRFGVTPFIDHAGALVDLESWCDRDDQMSAMLIDGVGGAGKTRTAVELARQLQHRGWLVGFYRYDTTAPLLALEAQTADRLIVFDYANDRPNQIKTVLDEIIALDQTPGRRTRLLLITRNGARSNSLSPITAHQSSSSALIQRAQTISFQRNDEQFDLPARTNLFDAAIRSIERGDSSSSPNQADRPDLEHDIYNSPLFVLFAAILQGQPVDQSGLRTKDQILEQILRRESELFWGTSPESDVTLREAAVCVATVASAQSRQEVLDRLMAIGYPANHPQLLQMANWLASLYSGGEWANGLEPDLLGEFLVLTRLPSGLVSHVLLNGGVGEVSSLLRVLTRIAVGWPGQGIRGAVSDVFSSLPSIAPHWLSDERNGDVSASDVLESAAEFLAAAPERFHLPHVDIPGRLGRAGARFAVEATRRWFNAAVNGSPERWIAGHGLAERLQRVGADDEARELVGMLIASSPADISGSDARAGQIRLKFLQARLAANTDAAITRIDETLRLLEELPPAERTAKGSLEAAVLHRRAVLLMGRGRRRDVLAALDAAIELRRSAVMDEGDAQVPGLAGSLRLRASVRGTGGDPESAVEDVVEAIDLLRSFTAGQVSIFEHDLARCYDVAARILAKQDYGRATSYAAESLRARARLAETFGVDAQIAYLSALIRTTRRHGGDLNFASAINLVTSILQAQEVTMVQYSQVQQLARSVLTLGPSHADAERLARALRDNTGIIVEDPSARASKAYLRLADRILRDGDVETALTHLRLAIGVTAVPSAHVFRRLPSFLIRARATTDFELVLPQLDDLVIELGEILVTTEDVEDLKLSQLLNTLAFVEGWLLQANVDERVLGAIRTAAPRARVPLVESVRARQSQAVEAYDRAFLKGKRTRALDSLEASNSSDGVAKQRVARRR